MLYDSKRAKFGFYFFFVIVVYPFLSIFFLHRYTNLLSNICYIISIIQAVVECLFTLQSLAVNLHDSLHVKMTETLPWLRSLLRSSSSAVRMQASITLAEILALPGATLPGMEAFITHVFILLWGLAIDPCKID